MKQVFYHYTLWEDFKNGMYDELKDGREDRVRLAVQLLCDTKLLYEQMTRVTKEWRIATAQNLTSPMNHQAYLGQTACNIWMGVKEDETREAWGRLSREQRCDANKVADRVYLEWLHEYERENESIFQPSIFDLED